MEDYQSEDGEINYGRLDSGDIERILENIKRDSTMRRLDPDNPICPGCGRRENADMLTYPTNLLTGVMQLCCPECCDDETAGMSLDEYYTDLVKNCQPISQLAISSHYRGILLPPNFYNDLETN